MLDSNPLLKHLRSKPQHTKNVIAIVAALIPTLAVSYAQFYMRAKDFSEVKSSEQVAEETKDVTIFAAVGKLFEEGKKTLGSSVDALKNMDAGVLDSAVISASGTPSATMLDKLDIGAVPGIEDSSTTVTKSSPN
ncbi:MAG TPA: hypothetical protein VJ579_03035 [Candidatus Paceibacterota bacterium]|nr:hypothetical protein [Candidatus Paceibacterota bacterium]